MQSCGNHSGGGKRGGARRFPGVHFQLDVVLLLVQEKAQPFISFLDDPQRQPFCLGYERVRLEYAIAEILL